MSSTNEQAARTAYLKRHPMRAVGRSFDEMQVFEIRRDSFQAGWDAAMHHARAERDAGEGVKQERQNLFTQACKLMDSRQFLREQLEFTRKHLTELAKEIDRKQRGFVELEIANIIGTLSVDDKVIAKVLADIPLEGNLTDADEPQQEEEKDAEI